MRTRSKKRIAGFLFARDKQAQEKKKTIDVYNLTNFHKEKVRSDKDWRHSKRNTEERLD